MRIISTNTSPPVSRLRPPPNPDPSSAKCLRPWPEELFSAAWSLYRAWSPILDALYKCLEIPCPEPPQAVILRARDQVELLGAPKVDQSRCPGPATSRLGSRGWRPRGEKSRADWVTPKPELSVPFQGKHHKEVAATTGVKTCSKSQARAGA